MKYLLYISLLVLITKGYAQDIESVVKSDPIKVSGSLSTSASYYNAWGIDSRRTPFYWTVNANLNFNFFGVVSAPFTLNFSPQGSQFSYPYQQMQPFNKMGISPKYKWLTVHLGYRSMNFSQYSYSGNNFNGVGVEIQPKKKWSFSTFYGRLARAITEVNNNNLPGIILYDRWAMGSKFRVGDGNRNVELIVFKAWDDQSSLILTDQSDETPPEDNMVVGINTAQPITKKLKLKLEYTLSAYTKNSTSEEVIGGYSYLGGFGGIYVPRTSSQYNSAINTGINYTHQKFNTGLTYRRVDPEYQSMGVPFLNNDMEDITANLSWRMFKNKMNITTNGGFQRNNLSNEQTGSTARVIGGVNTTFMVNEQINLNAGYSNFNTSTVRTRIELLDSLMYYQVTQSANAGVNYRFGSDSLSHAIMLMGNYQHANDLQQNESSLINGNLNYSINDQVTGLAIAVGVSGNINSMQGVENFGYGPVVSISKPFFEKQVRASINGNMLSYQNSGVKQFDTFNGALNLNYTLKKKHNFGTSVSYIRKDDKIADNSFEEVRASIKYGYSF